MISSRWTPATFSTAWVVALVVTAALDAFWLGWLAKDLYRREMGPLMADPIRWGPALAFYLLYPVAILYFGVGESSSWLEALGRGAAIGLLAYATYDLTNLATIRGWSAWLSMADVAWGTLLTALVCCAAYLASLGRSG